MSLAGQAVVAIWNGIAPEGRTEFYEWHNREHMPERVGIPGFRRGRRYIAKYGTPEYFTLYEANSAEVLVGQDYLNRLNNPTPWTQRVPPTFFRDTARGICRVKLSLGVGQGGSMLTLALRCRGRARGGAGAAPASCRAAAARRHRAGHRRASRHRRPGRERHQDHRARRPQGRHPELADHDRRRNAGSRGRSLRQAARRQPRDAWREEPRWSAGSISCNTAA